MNDLSLMQLSAYQLQADTGMTASELASLPMDEYARVTRRPTPTQSALAALDAETAEEPPGRQRASEPTPPSQQTAAPEPQAPGMNPNSQEYFLRWRQERQRGGEGRGIFDSVGSQSDAYTAAVRSQAGRTGWSTSNVQEAPRIERAYVPEEQPPAYRSARDRFYTPGNSFGG